MHCELFLMLGADYPYSEFLPRARFAATAVST
jgi:hypothetical protein